METGFVVAGILVYFVIGALLVRWYGKRLDALDEALIRERREELNALRMAGWTILMFIFWPLVWPYEMRNNFRQWRYPYCLR
jgi:hypothetical protein